MQRTPVTSSLIRSIGYDPAVNILEVELLSGRVYQYFMVPPAAYGALLAAESVGAYFNREVRRRYRCVEVS